jgi:hypothetical protein
VRLTINRCGAWRQFSDDQNAKAAGVFDANARKVRGKKEVVDRTNEHWKKVNGLCNAAYAYWKAKTVPYPVDGKRLLKKSDVPEFEAFMQTLGGQLATAKLKLSDHEADLLQVSEKELGELYSSADYNGGIAARFDVSWSFSEEQPPDYLRQLHPELYEREQKRIVALFDQAVADATHEFTEELAKVVSHIAETLAVTPGEKPKIFKDSTIGNLQVFFERFHSLNIGNDAELEAMVEKAKAAIVMDGEQVTPKQLRKDVSVRKAVAASMADLKGKLDQMVVERPKRKVKIRKEEG